jgi:hypothetical protein
MGLSSATGCFQRLTEWICQGMTDVAASMEDGTAVDGGADARRIANGSRAYELCILYVDDALIGTRGWAEEHLGKVRVFVERLQRHRVTLKHEKRSFGKSLLPRLSCGARWQFGAGTPGVEVAGHGVAALCRGPAVL